MHTEYESSPLLRPTKTVGSGKAWHTAGKGVTYSYGMNAAEEVRLYRISPEGILLSAGFFAPCTLEKVTETDEDGHVAIRFTDNRGRDILHISMDGAERLCTYYVYDYRDHLCLVLPPEASHRLENAPAAEQETILRRFAYRYVYDSRGRITEKRFPGCEPVCFVYDRRDRTILTQDGRQRSSSSLCWRYFAYDAKNRETENGEITLSSPMSREQLQAAYDASPDYAVTGLRTPLQCTYYDAYFPSVAHPFVSAEGYSVEHHLRTVGLVTGRKSRILGTDRWVSSTIYYDDEAREIYSVSTLPESDGQVKELRLHTAYNFTGQVVKSRWEVIAGNVSNNLESTFAYDDRGRLIMQKDFWNGLSSDTLHYVYDVVGRLTEKRRGNRTSEQYAYNVRGWLASHSLSGLSQRLHYTDGPGTPCYNGNLSSMFWTDGSSSVSPRGYRFTYDGLNRLQDAVYGEGNLLQSNVGRFNEQVTGYDKNGNITDLLRYGQAGAATYGLLDNLNLTYSGNQLQSVYDNAAHSSYGNGMSFIDGSNLPVEYAYDENGNLTKDLNKKIADIQYNLLNLPEKVEFENGDCICYLYAADGTKLRSTYISGDDVTTVSSFGSAVYENDVLTMVLTSDGYITPSDGKFHYYFYDHQGNVRAVLNQDGAVEETNDYYPFGGLMASSSSVSVQPYKYNGKELDRKGGLDWYDYGARWYDATIGRWHMVDPLAEKYYGITSYSYCGNNPVNYIDPFGMDYWSTSDPNEISRFLGTLHFDNGSIFEIFNFDSWNHATDSEFTGNLTFNDQTNTFYSSYGVVENGVPTSVGISVKALNVWEGGASIEGGRGRWYRRASGRLENIYPEHQLLKLF